MDAKAQGISEDWLSVWIGLLIFVLSLGVIAGSDILGWVVSTSVWTDLSKALGTASKNYSALGGFGALIATYIALLAVMTAGAYGAAQSGTYNSRPLIAEVLVKGSKFAIVRPRQTYEELIGLDHLAQWQEKSRT